MIDESRVTLHRSENVSPEEQAAITRILNANNDRFGYKWASTQVNITLKNDDGEIVGGLLGSTNWGWLHVDLLAVDEALRGCGFGTRLLQTAEDIGRERGCSFCYLDTFSFQAQGFYEKHGYTVWGTLENFPTGASRIFMRKAL